jgi:hypothetical protein
MDVRLSPEQVALRQAAAQVVDRLGVHGVADLDDGERASKLDAAVAASGWRELRTATDDGAPWASAVEVALVAEELGRGLADAAFIGATLAAELRRRAGAPASEHWPRRRAAGCRRVPWRSTPASPRRRWCPSAAPEAGPSVRSRSIRPLTQHAAGSTSRDPLHPFVRRGPSAPSTGKPACWTATTGPPGRASAWP